MRGSQPSPKDRSIPMTDEAMSPLRRRMIEDMTIRKFAPKTQHDYLQRVKNFTIHLGRSPDTASSERHCPKCQGAAAKDWLAAREADLLPVPYYHVVFTLPA